MCELTKSKGEFRVAAVMSGDNRKLKQHFFLEEVSFNAIFKEFPQVNTLGNEWLILKTKQPLHHHPPKKPQTHTFSKEFKVLW